MSNKADACDCLEVRVRAVMDFANLYLPTEYWYKARQHADNIRKGDA